MPVSTQSLSVCAPRKGLLDITDQVARLVAKAGLSTGMCTLFIRHTSASLIIQENYDPSARHDLETFMERLVPENAPWITHTLEGDDDMPSSPSSTWQGIYLWE